jgi:ABC-type antimicrobial peptide transport system permease subunit
VPLYQARTLEQVIARVVSTPRMRAGLIGVFALLAVLLASLGVYGVISYLVSQRTHEFGVRMSLGATADVRRLVLSDGLRSVAAGLVLGIVAAWGLGRAVQAYLFGVTPADPVSYAAAVALLVSAALVATLVPARRAARVPPVVALGNGVH